MWNVFVLAAGSEGVETDAMVRMLMGACVRRLGRRPVRARVVRRDAMVEVVEGRMA